jgi:hypothetical protein
MKKEISIPKDVQYIMKGSTMKDMKHMLSAAALGTVFLAGAKRLGYYNKFTSPYHKSIV